MSVGMPESLFLDEFGSHLRFAFGHTAYHVGSSLNKKTGWRDVDVRLLLPDEEWAAMELGDPGDPHRNGKWVAFTLAFSALGKQMTGLPVDFQLQQQSWANERYSHEKVGDAANRSALGMVPLRMMRLDKVSRDSARAENSEEEKRRTTQCSQ